MLPVDSNPPPTVIRETAPKIRIGMILDQPFPPDSRVEREAVALVEAGYEVHLLCPFHPDDVLADQAYRGFYIHRVDPDSVMVRLPWLGRSSRFLHHGWMRDLILRLKNIDTPWHTLIHRFARNCRLHVLHVHGHRLLDTALNISTHYGMPLVADLPDHYPAQMQLSHGRKREKFALDERHRWEELETQGILRASRVLTATPESRQRLLKKGIHPDMVMTLENTVEVENVLYAPVDPEVVRRFKSNFVLTYVGRLSEPYQGIQTVLEAMVLLKEAIPEMVFIGAGPIREGYGRQLLQLIEEQGLQDRVHFTGRLDETATVSYIAVSDICIFPHLVNDQTDTTFPEAIYRCQLLKKPVLLGNTQTMQRYAEETNGAMNFPSGDAGVLAEMLYMLYTRPDLRRDMSLNGHQAVMERYHWGHTASDLVILYDQLTGQFAFHSPKLHATAHEKPSKKPVSVS
jgi:glycosyltransferase involved in cell wall biosynthesis